jgi:NTE family protein
MESRTPANSQIDLTEYNVEWLMGNMISAESQAATRRGKTALVLAGGGLTGAVYEIGALRAIDDLLVDRRVTDFDMFVGTSAGAFVCTLLAAGITPCDMFQALDGVHSEARGPDPAALFRLDVGEYVRRGLRLPATLANIAWRAVRHPEDRSVFDLILALAGSLPPGIYDPAGIENYLAQALEWAGAGSTFADLSKDLCLIATELDTGARAVFSRATTPHLSVARAVAASSAVPVIYKPVEIDGVEYVDGGVRGAASLDLAVEHGAGLVVCINPMVPLSAEGRGRRRLSQRGASAIAAQTYRTVAHASLTYQIKQMQRRYRDVDFILIEPQPDDEAFFVENIMRYSARIAVAERGFQSVTVDLAHDYEKYKAVLASHGIPITRRLVIEELQAIQAAGNDRRAVQRMLHRSSRCPPPAGRNVLTYELDSTLNKLDRLLDNALAGRDKHSGERSEAPRSDTSTDARPAMKSPGYRATPDQSG